MAADGQCAAIGIRENVDVVRGANGKIEGNGILDHDILTVETRILEDLAELRDHFFIIVLKNLLLLIGIGRIGCFGDFLADVRHQIRDSRRAGYADRGDALGVVQSLYDGFDRPDFGPDALCDGEVRGVLHRAGYTQTGRDMVLHHVFGALDVRQIPESRHRGRICQHRVHGALISKSCAGKYFPDQSR